MRTCALRLEPRPLYLLGNYFLLKLRPASFHLKATLVYLMAAMVYSGLFHYPLQCESLLFSISFPILNTLQLILLSFVLREHICAPRHMLGEPAVLAHRVVSSRKGTQNSFLPRRLQQVDLLAW